MSTQTAYLPSAPGNSDLFAFPFSKSLADWATHRVALAESAAPNTGRYSADLDDAKGFDWAVFDGTDQPSSFNDFVATISLPRLILLSPFLDEPVPSDWTLSLTDRSLGDEVDRVLEVKPGERYMAAVDCRVVMAPGQSNLYQFDLPTTATSWLSIVPTTDLANPQHGKAGRLVKFQFEISESATANASGAIDLVIWSTQFSRVRPKVTIKVQ